SGVAPRRSAARTLGAAPSGVARNLSVYGERDAACSPARIGRECPRPSERWYFPRSLLSTDMTCCKSSTKVMLVLYEKLISAEVLVAVESPPAIPDGDAPSLGIRCRRSPTWLGRFLRILSSGNRLSGRSHRGLNCRNS